MSQQVRGTAVSKEEEIRLKRASGSQLYSLVHALRRKGFTASFGADKDPKLLHAK